VRVKGRDARLTFPVAGESDVTGRGGVGRAVTTAVSVQGLARFRRAWWHPARHRVFDLELDAEVTEVRQRIEAARMRTYRHDLINAFAAVDCAAMLLVQETLDPPDRVTLAELLGSGLNDLRRLLVRDPDEQNVDLADLMASHAHEPGWPGAAQVKVPSGLMVVGSYGEIAEAVRQVLAQARRRAPSTPPCVRAARNGDRIELWVDDRGPTLTARQRRQVLQPDARRSWGPAAAGGLDVAIRLVRGQGGDVEAHAQRGGGESFGMSWRAPLG
jgi:signal transduction histidine kinase